MQRLGRTGRRSDQRANTTSFCEDVETVLQAIAIVELARKGWVEAIPNQTRVWAVFVHQLRHSLFSAVPLVLNAAGNS